jgi:hypothetical protein
MDNPVTLSTLCTRHRTKTKEAKNKNKNHDNLPKVHFLVFALKFVAALLSKSGSLNTEGFPFLVFFASS